MDRIFVHEKILFPGGCLPLPRGHICVYDHNVQTSPLKPLGQSKPNYVEHREEGAMKVCINGHGHMTKMAAMAINSKNL